MIFRQRGGKHARWSGPLVASLSFAGLLAMGLAACGSGAAPTASASASSQAPGDWNQVVAQANKEGQVVVVGSGNTDATADFSKRYPQIKVDYSPISGGDQIPPKILAEQAAGKNFTDVLQHGGNALMTLRDANALADLHQFLTGPDIDPPKWRDGKLQFVDNDAKYMLVYSAYAKLGPLINEQQVDAKQLTSWNDVLDPKWKGKIIVGDPSGGGAGFGLAWYWYVTPGLGKPFLEQLFQQQNVTLSRNNQQAVNSVAHGTHLLGLGIGDNSAAGADMKGLGAKAVDWKQLKDPPYVTAGLADLAVTAKAPHPNATRVYLNWLLSLEGQTTVTNAANLPSLRQDVPTDSVFPPMRLQPNVKYFTDFGEDAIRQEQKDAPAIRAIVG